VGAYDPSGAQFSGRPPGRGRADLSRGRPGQRENRTAPNSVTQEACRDVSVGTSGTMARALLLPGETNLLTSAVRELADLFGISPEEAERRRPRGSSTNEDAWNAAPAGPAGRIEDFYNTSQTTSSSGPLARDTFRGEDLANVASLAVAERLGVRRYLDLARRRSQPAPVRCRWHRGGRRGHLGPAPGICAVAAAAPGGEGVVLRSQDRLPAERTLGPAHGDGCLEHVRSGSRLSAPRSPLSRRGVLYRSARFGFDPDRPMHLVIRPEVSLGGACSRSGAGEPRELAEYSFLRAYRPGRSGVGRQPDSCWPGIRSGRERGMMRSRPRCGAGSREGSRNSETRLPAQRVSALVVPGTGPACWCRAWRVSSLDPQGAELIVVDQSDGDDRGRVVESYWAAIPRLRHLTTSRVIEPGPGTKGSGRPRATSWRSPTMTVFVRSD